MALYGAHYKAMALYANALFYNGGLWCMGIWPITTVSTTVKEEEAGGVDHPFKMVQPSLRRALRAVCRSSDGEVALLIIPLFSLPGMDT